MIYQQIEQSNTPELADFALPVFERKNTWQIINTGKSTLYVMAKLLKTDKIVYRSFERTESLFIRPKMAKNNDFKSSINILN